MFITKRHLPRRTVLRGLGAALALPVLDCMVPALTVLAKTAAAPVRRFGVFYPPNGMAMGYWYTRDLAEGPLNELPPIMRSLDELKERVLLIGGLASEAAKNVRGADHPKAATTFLTGAPFKVGGSDLFAAVSMDQIAAKELGKETQLTSLELGTDDPALLGNCDGGNCAYTNTIAWRTPTTPLPVEHNPRALFERMFGTNGSTDRGARLARIKRDRSILDFVTNSAARLKRVIGPQDKAKLAEYFDSVRDIERRIQMVELQNRELPVVDEPVGVPSNYEEHVKLLMDLLALAYQTDLTRVSTFLLAKEQSPRAYPEIGVSDSHHPMSHHQDDPLKIERLSKINEYHFQQFAYFVKKLATIPEGDATLLDHSLFLYGTGLSDSNSHFHDDLPIALVGGKASGIKGGHYVRNPKGTPLANLHLAILEKLGVPVETFGDSTGKLDGWTVKLTND